MRFLRPLRGKGGKGNPIWEKDDVMNTIWKPQPRQRDFMIRTEYEALYGGAAGGGKSEALVCEALRQVDKPFYRGLLIRKTFSQLEELVSKSLRYYKAAYPGAKYNGSQHKWTFPSGAQIYFGSMPNKNSYLNYQGLSYEYIGVDELTHFTQAEYEYLTSRNRANGEGARVYIRATANPGGIGHGWVKDRFVTVTKPNTTHTYTAEAIAPDGTKYNVERTRVFIPSSVFDNKILLANDPSYIGTLAMMPEAQKRALLYGEWDSFEGQVFTEFRNNSDGYLSGINTHVIEPFEIPRHWRRYRAYDFGYSKPYAVLWFAVDTEGRAYLYRELYGASGANIGVREEASLQAKKVREIEDELEQGADIIGVADPAIWEESRGKANRIITMFEKQGVYFQKGDNRRLAGKMQVHERLRFDEDGRPGLYIMNNCRNTIRTLPALVYDTRNVEDVDSECEDHIYDALRYFLMTVPAASKPLPLADTRRWTPLGLY